MNIRDHDLIFEVYAKFDPFSSFFSDDGGITIYNLMSFQWIDSSFFSDDGSIRICNLMSFQCIDCGPYIDVVLLSLRIARIFGQLSIIIVILAQLRTTKPICNLFYSVNDLRHCTSNVSDNPSTTDCIWSGHR